MTDHNADKDAEILSIRADLEMARGRISDLSDAIDVGNDAIRAKDKRIEAQDAELAYLRGVVADLSDKINNREVQPAVNGEQMKAAA